MTTSYQNDMATNLLNNINVKYLSAVSLSNSFNQTFAQNIVTTVTLPNVEFLIGNDFSTATPNSIVINASGTYQIRANCTVVTQVGGVNLSSLAIYKNGNVIESSALVVDTPVSGQIVVSVPLAQNDIITLKFTTQTTSNTISGTLPSKARLSILRLN